MDTKSLRNKWDILKKNQDYLHFEIKTSTDKEGYIHISTNVVKKHEKYLNLRLNDLVLEALKIGLQLYDLKDIAYDDKEEYIAKWEASFDRDKEIFISILLNEGVDNYLAAIMSSAEKLNLSYFIENIHPVRSSSGDIVLHGPNKTFFEDGKWKRVDDPTYQRSPITGLAGYSKLLGVG